MRGGARAVCTTSRVRRSVHRTEESSLLWICVFTSTLVECVALFLELFVLDLFNSMRIDRVSKEHIVSKELDQLLVARFTIPLSNLNLESGHCQGDTCSRLLSSLSCTEYTSSIYASMGRRWIPCDLRVLYQKVDICTSYTIGTADIPLWTNDRPFYRLVHERGICVPEAVSQSLGE